MVKILRILRNKSCGDNVKCVGLVNITDDPRTSLIPKDAMIQPKFKVDDQAYIVKNDLMLKLARKRGSQDIDALYFKHKDNDVVIIGNKTYVFWNGRSVEPESFSLLFSQKEMKTHIDKLDSMKVVA